MSVEIKTSTLEPIRNTFRNIEKRFGDKPATRYQEASYDIQGIDNFHYSPAWQTQFNINDANRTAIKMNDWYILKDPRQFYYGTYVSHRAKMQENSENNYNFFEKRKLVEYLDENVKEKIIKFIIPFRHLEQTANLNNMYGTAYGYGTIITQALCFDAMDRLGIAQYFSKIGLLLDGNTGESLAQAKEFWLHDPVWQGVRALCEESLLTDDWYELLIAQNLVIDSLVGSLIYSQFDQWLIENNGRDVTILFEFMQEWQKSHYRWLESILKTTAQESDHNKSLLTGWVKKWREKALDALNPLALEMLNPQALDIADIELAKRLKKSGIT